MPDRSLERRLAELERELQQREQDTAGTNLRLAAMFILGIATGSCLVLLAIDILEKTR